MAQQFAEALDLETLDQVMNEGPGLESRSPTQWLESVEPAAAKDDDRELILEWISELRMLQGIPLNYLVPDMAMLPPESLRFFQVDRAWIGALVDGAFSLGRRGADMRAASGRQSALGTEAEQLVQQCHLRDRMVTEQLGTTPPRKYPSDEQMSGFLLRSELLAAWPGLEVEGSSADGKALAIVRMELLAPGVLLCLFNRVLNRVRFKGPAEASHFGVEVNPEGLIKQLRAYGKTVPTQQRVDVPVRSGGRRVISLAGLADGMGKQLPPALSAAQFAIQMTEGAKYIEFVWSPA